MISSEEDELTLSRVEEMEVAAAILVVFLVNILPIVFVVIMIFGNTGFLQSNMSSIYFVAILIIRPR